MLNSVCCIAAEGFVHILLTIEEPMTQCLITTTPPVEVSKIVDAAAH